MKFEYINVRDREARWFKGPENLFVIGKGCRLKAMQFSWGKFQGDRTFCSRYRDIRDREKSR